MRDEWKEARQAVALAGEVFNVFAQTMARRGGEPEKILGGLNTPEGLRVMTEGVDRICDEYLRSTEKSRADLLEFVGTTIIPATTEPFVAKDRFLLKKDGGICSNFSNNFTTWFLSGKGKIEEPISETTLHYDKLRQSSLDIQIIAELGGKTKAETTLTEMFSLMEKQRSGESGPLLNNGRANIFYVKDQNSLLCTVYVYWNGDGWFVSALSVERSNGWGDGGRQVFSRLPASL